MIIEEFPELAKTLFGKRLMRIKQQLNEKDPVCPACNNTREIPSPNGYSVCMTCFKPPRKPMKVIRMKTRLERTETDIQKIFGDD